MKCIFPHRFKKVGTVVAPVGLLLWLAMQLGYIDQLLRYVFEEPAADYQLINIIAAVLGFFSFIGGVFMMAFSREKIEDEMVQRTRLDAFQFAAFIQIVFIMGGFISMLFAGDPSESGMLIFFIVLVALFWLSFILRFNYVLFVKYRNEE